MKRMVVSDRIHSEIKIISQNKKELKRINWNIVKKLIVLLHYNGRMKRTNIAMRCNMGYDKCLLYLNWLDLMDLIKKEIDEDGFELIRLTDKGHQFYDRKLKDVEINFAN